MGVPINLHPKTKQLAARLRVDAELCIGGEVVEVYPEEAERLAMALEAAITGYRLLRTGAVDDDFLAIRERFADQVDAVLDEKKTR